MSLLACNAENRSSKEKVDNSQPFVNFSLPDLEGKQHSLSDYSGKVLLVNFWATWCAPCIAELPSLEKLSKSLESEDFEVVAISIDSSSAVEDVVKLKNKLGLTFGILLDHEMSIPPKLGITGFPETFFVGKQGEMLEFYDPVNKKKSIRVISDRDWNSTEIKNSIKALLKK